MVVIHHGLEEFKITPPAGSAAPRLRAWRAARDQGVDQTQHQRESLPAVAQGAEGCACGGGRTVAAVSKSDGAGVAREIGEVPRLPRREPHHWQWLRRTAGAGRARIRGTGGTSYTSPKCPKSEKPRDSCDSSLRSCSVLHAQLLAVSRAGGHSWSRKERGGAAGGLHAAKPRGG